MSSTQSVGRSIPRVDGEEKVTGRARYVDDLTRPGLWWGATARSVAPHAILKRIVLPDPLPADVVVVTAADIPGLNGIQLLTADQVALVPEGGRIRHPHEAVALVAAPDARTAKRVAAAIELELEPLPAVFDFDAALRGDVVVHQNPDAAPNVYSDLTFGRGDVDAALAECDLVLEGTYTTASQEQMYIEPQGMLAEWKDGTCYVTGSLQCPYYVHKSLVALLDLPPEQVVVDQAVTGGGFGGKEEYPSMIAAHAALLARRAGRPVKLIYDRSEDLRATPKRHPSRVKHRMGFKRDGTLVAVDVDVLLDGGAYTTLSPVVLSRGVLHAPGPYRAEHVRVRGRAVATNHPPQGAFRGFGAPQTTFPYERQMQKAALQLGIDPWVLRRQNRLREGDTTATGQVLRWSVGSTEVLDKAEEVLASPPPHRSTHTQLPADPSALRRGRGVAFYFHGAGFTGRGEERLKGTLTLALCADGVYEIRSTSTDIGQGTLTTFAQIAADVLEVEASAIRFAPRSTAVAPDSGPTVASRTCMIMGAVVDQAALELRTALAIYGREVGLEDPDDLAAAAAHHAQAKGELARTCTYHSPEGISFDDTKYEGDAYPAYGWAVCVVDVAVDLDTFEVAVERCVHVIDVGKAIHPLIVKGQIEGGTLQALGWALWEQVTYADDGRVLNDRMTNCIIPTSLEAPELETHLVEVPYPHGPFGAKGVGEIPMDGPAAAVANAIEDALGIPIDQVPVTPEVLARLWTSRPPEDTTRYERRA
ncbi:MAG: xanthine dehydrogenase family protein [Planctomycetes bacterium]|nr:xanthine dehydrogenase family protein [Planctomycetota bacterium]